MKKIVTLCALGIIGAGLVTSVSARAEVYFRDTDRVILKDYVTAPSETTTFYSAGTVLPETVTYTELPATVTTKLVAAPAGDEYVSAGGNVYLIDKSNRKVIDAVQLY
jgi:hypothetical protein